MVYLRRGVGIPGSAPREVIATHQTALVERVRAIVDFRAAERRGADTAPARSALDVHAAVLARLEGEHEIPFTTMCRALGLGQRDRDALAVIAGPHLDDTLRESIAAYWGRPARSHVDAALVVELLCLTRADAVHAGPLYIDGGPLHAAGLVESAPVTVGHVPSQLEHELLPAPRLLRTLNGQIGLDPRFQPFCHVLAASEEPARGVVTPPFLDRAAELVAASHAADQRRRARVLIPGGPGAGKLRLALALARRIGRPRVLVAESAFLTSEPIRLARTLEALAVEAEVLGAQLVLRRIENLVDGPRMAAVVAQAVSTIPHAVWLTSDVDHARTDAPHLADLATLSLSVPPTDAALRSEAWRAELERHAISVPAEDLRMLASEFPVTRGAIETAAALVGAQEPAARGDVVAALAGAAESQTRGQLARFARRSRSHARLEHVVLTENTREQLVELLEAARRRTEVMDVWGLSDRHATGRGLVALFNGPPGTGKTLAATAIANELDLPLYRIDVSTIVDRFVGETEKNLTRLFAEASACRAALLFDEADSLFGKRVEASDATGRYANMHVNMLLNLIEDYDGFVVLTTNLKGALDAAFLRRIAYKVVFEAPDQEERLALWEYHLPTSIPRAPDVDLDALAEEFDGVAGGDIKNAVLRAALASAGTPVTQARLRRSIINELIANGGVVTERR